MEWMLRSTKPYRYNGLPFGLSNNVVTVECCTIFSICRNRKLPERAGTYHIIFVYNDHKHNIDSNEVGTSNDVIIIMSIFI